MSYDAIFSIAAQGMSIEKLRVDVVANNIANQHSIQRADGSLFKPGQVVTTAQPFSDFLQTPVVDIIPQNLPPEKIYAPEHPAADRLGYITYPGINMIDEMTTLLRASRAYEANIKIINTAHTLYLQALTIGEEK